MAEKGRVAIFAGVKKDFRFREFPVPDPEPGAVLVKIAAATICGSDLHIWRGDMGPAWEAPPEGSVLGHEMMGRVYRLGKGVTKDSLGRPLKEGDRVVYAYFYPCYQCPVCATGDVHACPNRKAIGDPVGQAPYFTAAFGDYYYLKPRHHIFKVPDELTDEMVAPVNCAFSEVAFGLVKADPKFGETVVIQGAGGLGLYATALARERGARVITVDGQKARLALAKRMGADEVIDMTEYPTPEARAQRVRDLTGGLGADLTVGVVGFAPAFAEALQMVRSGGRHLEIGAISQVDKVEVAPAHIVYRRITVIGVGVYDPWIIPKVLEFMVRTRHKYPYHEIVSNKYPLSEISRAFRESEWRRAGQSPVTRALLVP